MQVNTAARSPAAHERAPRAATIATWARRSAYSLLFLLFIGVRIYHLERAPAHNDTTDEYAWTWSGMTFLQSGKPRAWSNLKAYLPHREIVDWREHRYHVVEPWLDHPPLYSLFAGSWIRAWGRHDMYDVDLWEMRTGSVLLAALSFIGLAAFLRYFLAPAEVLVSLLLYAVLPTIVWQQRLVVSENLFLPLTLGVLLLLQAQASRFASWRVVALLFASALLPLTKVAALSCSVFAVVWALASTSQRSRWVNTGALVLGTSLGIAGYFAWGNHFNSGLFHEILNNHEARFRGFSGMQVLLFEPQLINKPTRDVLAIMSSVLALASLWQRPTAAPWGLAVLIYSACMCFFVDDHRVFGWYFLPLYPWLCVGLGTAIVDASRRRLVGLSLLWCMVAAVSIAKLLQGKELAELDHLRKGYLLGVLLLSGAWFAWPRIARATIPAVNGLLLAATALASLYEVYLR